MTKGSDEEPMFSTMPGCRNATVNILTEADLKDTNMPETVWKGIMKMTDSGMNYESKDENRKLNDGT